MASTPNQPIDPNATQGQPEAPKPEVLWTCTKEIVENADGTKSAVGNFTICRSAVQTLRIKTMGEDGKPKYEVLPKEKVKELLVRKTTAKGKKLYKFGRNVAIPALRKPKNLRDFGKCIEEYCAALDLYDAATKIVNTKGEAKDRLVTICMLPKVKGRVDSLLYVWRMLQDAVKLSVQKQGQKVTRPKAEREIAKLLGWTLYDDIKGTGKGDEQVVEEDDDYDPEDDLS